ncbi:MAG: metal-binding protein [Acidobacteria bacterium]|nr:MAG: metal-binding protein [Acidobacteriota bacterium]
MPSGKTHDAITIFLTVPVFAGTYVVTRDLWLATFVSAAFLFGGLMFGPDLDTTSKQYSRWTFIKFLWFPYRAFFKHRSRWSHGLIFGTLFRVIYFMGVMTLAAFLTTYVYASYAGGKLPEILETARVWSELRVYSNSILGSSGLIAIFGGLWIGAASHTFTDLAGSYVKTGRVTEFL